MKKRFLMMLTPFLLGCGEVVCGDLVLKKGVEACDDGNLVDGDGCDSNCTLTACGNGVATEGEECDDGNDDNNDACIIDKNSGRECQSALCGDGFTQTGVETCDDGNTINDDTCTTLCRAPFCGDGFLQPGEACDDGNVNNNDNCPDDIPNGGACQLPRCGDGFLLENSTEACDDGNNLSNDGCRSDCLAVEVCGDGVVQAAIGEECDDGEAFPALPVTPVSGDGCDSNCIIEICGDGVVNNAGTEECDDGNGADGDGCDVDCQLSCGNGVRESDNNEFCDDGNNIDNDGCNRDCTLSEVIQIAPGGLHTCALLSTGDVRCWGSNNFGQLGYGNTTIIGDDEGISSAPNVPVGGRVTQLAVSPDFSCALLDTGGVRCWGKNDFGQLGYGDSNNVGDNETPASKGDIDLGGPATFIAAGLAHTCAIMEGGSVRCWGNGNFLGYGNTNTIGDNEAPATAGDLNLGGQAIHLSAHFGHTCAVLTTGGVRCWGGGSFGRLGYGNTNSVGTTNTPADVGDIDLGGQAVEVAAGAFHTCARLNNGKVRCWGTGSLTGYGNGSSIGDNEAPSVAGDLNLGGDAVQLLAGLSHTCALLDTGRVRCWGQGSDGRLGYGNENSVGSSAATGTPADAGDVPIGGAVKRLGLSFEHTCAVIDSGHVRCWGQGGSHLGYGLPAAEDIGDDELIFAVGAMSLNRDIVHIATGGSHSCAVNAAGAVQCWGEGANGRLGYGNTNIIGDTELPSSAGNISIAPVAQMTAGKEHTCALSTTGTVRCWGKNVSGKLGYQSTIDVTTPLNVGDVVIGGPVAQISAGVDHTCALLTNGNVRCWGEGDNGRLGYGNTSDIGLSQTPASAGDIDLGGRAIQISAGGDQTCAVMESGALRCWGFSTRLGYGNNNNVGDDETPASVGDVPLVGAAVQVAAGSSHTCALLSTGAIRCWGSGADGRLGYGDTNTILNAADAEDVNVGGRAVSVVASDAHTCALLETGAVRCWGKSNKGQLGYGNEDSIGNNEAPSTAGDVNLGAPALQISAGGFLEFSNTCALLQGGIVRCWGSGLAGRNGRGNTDDIGDDELPTTLQPDLPLFGTTRASLCGDDIFQPELEEECEDGNHIDGDGCDSNCTLTACGNGVTTSGEQCDDGNTINSDGCQADCSLVCGQGSGAELATLDPSSGSCYLGFHSRLEDNIPWTRARAHCEDLGGHLAIISNAAENATARSPSILNLAYWIGFNDIVTEAGSNPFAFVDVLGALLTFHNFAPGEPNNFNGNQDCARFFEGSPLWDDEDCLDLRDQVKGYLCELP